MAASTFSDWVTLANYAIKRFDKRREFEWKVILGFWAAIAAVGSPAVNINSQTIPQWTWAGGWALFVFLWIRATWVANEADKRLAAYYLGKAESDANNQSRPGKISTHDCDWWFGFLDWARIFQALATAGIMMAVSGKWFTREWLIAAFLLIAGSLVCLGAARLYSWIRSKLQKTTPSNSK
jgi:hypothetical protein